MLAWLRTNLTLVAVATGIIVAGLWVHDHTQQAVARALLHQQVDSIAAKVSADSIAAVARDSTAREVIAAAAQSEAAAQATARHAAQQRDSATQALTAAKTARDTIVVYQQALVADSAIIVNQSNAITAADAQIVALKRQILDRDGQIASLQGIARDLQQKLEKATHPSVLNGTTLTIVKTVLAVKGAYDVFRGR